MKGKAFLPTVLISVSLFLTGCGRDGHEGAAHLELLQSQIIIDDLGWKEITSLSSSNPIRVNGKAVADLDLPALGSRCTGFMISDDVLMTNQHCIPTSSHARGVTAYFKHEKGVSKPNWKGHDCSEFIGNNRALDFALLKCKGKPGAKYGKVQLSSKSMRSGNDIYVVQQNCDYYSNRGCDWSKKYSLGEVVRVEDEYVHNADTLGGSSGSPVFDSVTHKVIGLHHAGLGNNGMGRGIENYAVPMKSVLANIQANFPGVLSNSSGGGQQDASEPNDSRSAAFKLTANAPSKAFKIGSSSDVDYYKVVVDQAGTLSFYVSFTNSAGDLDIKLYNSSGSELAKSNSTKNFEKVSKFVSRGTYYLRVYGYRGAQNRYAVKASFAASSASEEPNDEFSKATVLSLPATKSQREVSSAEDVDYYKFKLTTSSYKVLKLEFTHSVGDLDLEVYKSNGEKFKFSNGTKNTESISSYFPKGTYYVKVYGYRGATGKYNLKVN